MDEQQLVAVGVARQVRQHVPPGPAGKQAGAGQRGGVEPFGVDEQPLRRPLHLGEEQEWVNGHPTTLAPHCARAGSWGGFSVRRDRGGATGGGSLPGCATKPQTPPDR